MALQEPSIMPLSRLDCPLSLKTPNMGNTGLDGTVRNLIGQDAERLIKDRIKKWLDSQQLIVQRNDEETLFELPGGYSMRYGSEPDIEFNRSIGDESATVATIEIKGG